MRLGEEFAELVVSHFAVGGVFQRVNWFAVFLIAHDAPECHDTAHVAAEFAELGLGAVDWLIGEEQFIGGRFRPALEWWHQRKHIAVAEPGGSIGKLQTDGDQGRLVGFPEPGEFYVELREGVGDSGAIGQIERQFVLSRELTEETEELDGNLHVVAAIASARNVPT